MSNYESAEKRYNAVEFEKYVKIESKRTGSENTRYELINGFIYMMGSPNVTHYNLCKYMELIFIDYFANKSCRVFNGSVDLFLFNKKRFKLFKPPMSIINDVVIPDLMVVCNEKQIRNRGIFGAPELVVEVTSKSTSRKDHLEKLNAYGLFGVKEYWIVNPIKRRVTIHDLFSDPDDPIGYNYSFDDTVHSKVFDGLFVDFKQFTGFVED